jgi:fatty-acyl-CoA synthase
LRRTAARVPNRLAIRCGDVSWTYAAFDRLCDHLAAGCAAQQIGVGDRVAVLARNSHAFVAVRFALARLGAVLVPINFMLKSHEVAYILNHSEAKALWVDAEFVTLGTEAAASVPSIRQLLWMPSESPTVAPAALQTFEQLLSAPLGDFEMSATVKADSLAQISYTSGTESLPKGAMLTHEAVICEYVSSMAAGDINPGDHMLHALPLFHCAQLDAFMGPCLYVGATNFITSRPTPENLLALIDRYQITSLFLPPTVWITLLRSSAFDPRTLRSLRKGYFGASIMPLEVLRELQSRLPDVRFWNLYGQTEITGVATALQPEDQLRKPGSCGRAVLNVETRVVDDGGHAVAPGVIGEIVHRSPQLMRGYFRDPQRTRSAFAGGWFHSGDLATIDEEGYITIVDRKKDMIKSGGENVASREVEDAIYRLSQVSEVAVIGLPDPVWIEAITAVIVLKAGEALTEHAVAQHCKAILASFKAPKRVLFVSSLPKSASGKLLKRVLREQLAENGSGGATP